MRFVSLEERCGNAVAVSQLLSNPTGSIEGFGTVLLLGSTSCQPQLGVRLAINTKQKEAPWFRTKGGIISVMIHLAAELLEAVWLTQSMTPRVLTPSIFWLDRTPSVSNEATPSWSRFDHHLRETGDDKRLRHIWGIR